MSARTARWLSISILGLYLLLLGSGLYLQMLLGVSYAGIDLGIYFLIGLVIGCWAGVGTLIVWYHPRHPIGWILCVWPVTFGLELFAFGYAYYGLVAHPGALPAAEAAYIWVSWNGYAIPFISFTLLYLWFPNGRPLSARWRWAGRIGIAAVIIYVLLETIEPGRILTLPSLPENPFSVSEALWDVLNPVRWTALFIAILCLLAAGISLIVRFRQSKGEARQQIKWFAFFALFFPLGNAIAVYTDRYPNTLLLGIAIGITMFSVLGMAIATGFAIFRYRLYAIDLIIRRTLIYGSLTAILALVYFGGVTLFNNVFTVFSGQRSAIAVVLSTLAIAALFNPLRVRLQRVIDGRFYRTKYDAEIALSNFSVRAREDVALERLSISLLKIVDETFQPGYTSLWLREP